MFGRFFQHFKQCICRRDVHHFGVLNQDDLFFRLVWADIGLSSDFTNQLDRELGFAFRGTEDEDIRVTECAKRLFAGRTFSARPVIFSLTNKSGGCDSRQRLFSGSGGSMQQISVPQRPAARRRCAAQDADRVCIADETVKAGYGFHQIFSNRSTSVTIIVAPPTVTSTGIAV